MTRKFVRPVLTPGTLPEELEGYRRYLLGEYEGIRREYEDRVAPIREELARIEKRRVPHRLMIVDDDES